MDKPETRVDRLMALFADRHVDQLDPDAPPRLEHGFRNLCIALGEDKATVSRWNSSHKRGNHGNVPPRYNAKIIDACDRYGIPRSKLVNILEDQECPCCGQPLEPGHLLRGARP